MDERPVPILYVHSSADVYGSDMILLYMVSHLDRDCYTPLVLLPTEGPLVGRLRRLGVEVLVRPLSIIRRIYAPSFWFRFVASLYQSSRWMCDLIRERGIKLVHSNTSHVLNGALAARWAGVAHVWHVREMRGAGSPVGRLLEWMLYTLSDRILVMSDAVRCAVFSPSRRDDPRIVVVPDGIEVSRFAFVEDGDKVRAELGIGRAPLAGVVGRIAGWKGHRLFLEAAARVHTQLPEARFLIVGDAVTSGDLRVQRELHRRVTRLGLQEAVIFTGVREDIPQVMAALDVLVLPSLQPEPFGLVMLEAMAAGRPVIATNHGGPVEVIEDRVTGVLVPPTDPEPLAEALLMLFRDPDRARAMGAAGQVRCLHLYTAQRMAREVMGHYATLLKGR